MNHRTVCFTSQSALQETLTQTKNICIALLPTTCRYCIFYVSSLIACSCWILKESHF
ncbi:hypothetical protein AB205_0138920 [Aquarana catesbeiana]|uniref:Uncharacterized protein n=1 Tax=Aquarana catesbeiana TaxID=8400 RepID=A0A2G9S8B8_AQUCT|nr:hypothetical protein AB205_0138920 [Aquarana catesbeiana]